MLIIDLFQPVTNIFFNTGRKQHRLLLNITYFFSPFLNINIFYIYPINQNFSIINIIKPLKKSYYCRFTSPWCSNQSYWLSRLIYYKIINKIFKKILFFNNKFEFDQKILNHIYYYINENLFFIKCFFYK